MKKRNLFFKEGDLQLSFIICCLVDVIFTIVKECSPFVKTLLKDVFSNSWLGQTLIMILLFVLFAMISKVLLKTQSIRFALLLPTVLAGSILILFVFYGMKG